MSLKKKIISFLIFLPILCFAFKPAPPPGTPSFRISPVPQIRNIHIDCFVIEDKLQVAFLASLSMSKDIDELKLVPKWPIMDSLTLFVIEDNSETEYPIPTGRYVEIEPSQSEFIIRLTYEIDINLAVSGPPGPWKYARHFAFYPPFIDADDTAIQPDNYRIRFMLPQEIQPKTCLDNLKSSDSVESFTSWEYEGEITDNKCRFSE